MKNRILCFVLILFLLADLCYSFAQHLSQPLDGDMAWNIVPGNDVKPVLADPFGFGAFINHRSYPNPNRFFCHYTMKGYFETVPLVLQKFVQPVESVYLSCAIAKIAIQLSLIMLLAMGITGSVNPFKTDFLVAAVLVTPLFQTEGYQSYMGIIDRCTTYTFFYALPVAFLMVYFSPFLLQNYYKKRPSFRLLIYVLWIPFAAVICLSGPLNPGIALIISLLVFTGILHKNYRESSGINSRNRIRDSILKIPGNYWFYLLPVSILSLYSLFLGRYNSNNIHIPIVELYARIPAGLYYPLTKKLGFPVLLLAIAFNQLMIRRNFKTEDGLKAKALFKWIGCFALLYLLLLPLGGYREYRPNVIRYDTIMPVTLGLVFLFGYSTLFLFKNMENRQKKWYIPLICGILVFFTINDEEHFDKNTCEKDALKQISVSYTNVVRLQSDCDVLSWQKITDPGSSNLNADLLKLWHITKDKKLYYNE